MLNHVLLHQTVIGQEAIAQLAMADAEPDVVIGCVGGGSNFAGLVFPFLRGGCGRAQTRIVAAEPAACPTLTRGVYGYDFGDTVGMTPLMPMYTLGHDFVPPPVHAGGLRYHGDAPMVCGLVKAGRIEARAYKQNETFEAAVRFARSEGIIPAPEPAHAIRAVIEEAEAAREAGEERTILFGLCGHGNFDLAAYDAYLGGDARGPRVLRGGAAGRARRAAGGAVYRLSYPRLRMRRLTAGVLGMLFVLLAPAGARAQTQPAPDKDAAVILVVDASKSMRADDGSGQPEDRGGQVRAQHAGRRAARRREGRPAGVRLAGQRHRAGEGLRGLAARLAGGAAGPQGAQVVDQRDHAARLHADRGVAAGAAKDLGEREAEDGRARLRRRRQLRAAGAVQGRAASCRRAA